MKGYILAGGLSQRFGSDKARYLVDGEPLAVRIAAVLRAAGLDPWLVARAPRGLGLPELLEPDGPRHPLWGVAAALGEGSDAFVIPCDLVDVRVEQVRALSDAGAIAAGQPLFGVYPARLRDRARAFAEAGGSVRAFVAELPVLDVGPIANLNQPIGS
ncbi:MAG: NTP transferase domain-containing protein [Pseudomonadota bacterium]|nr:NTP transferase domain-containing protein [Pseudomonadota bacterium]